MKRGLSLGDIAASVGACSNAPSTQVRNSSKRSKKSVTSENIQSCTCGAESKITELSAQVMSLQQSVKELSSQVSFLLSFVGAVESSPVASLQESQTLQTSVAVSVPAASNSSQQSNMESTSISSSAGSSLLPRSYAATVTQPSVTKSAPVYKAVLSAVYSELSERTRRSRNMVITGLPTVHGTVDKDLFTDLCVTEFGVNPNIAACRRLGRVRDDGRARPLLLLWILQPVQLTCWRSVGNLVNHPTITLDTGRTSPPSGGESCTNINVISTTRSAIVSTACRCCC